MYCGAAATSLKVWAPAAVQCIDRVLAGPEAKQVRMRLALAQAQPEAPTEDASPAADGGAAGDAGAG